MITQGTPRLSSFVKSMISSLSLKVASVCDVKKEKKYVRLFIFKVIMEDNLRTQTNLIFVPLKK